MGRSYRPFIDDPAHIALVAGECYVVLRPTVQVPRVYQHVQALIKEKLRDRVVSYPAQPHVTLAGFSRETDLETVRQVVEGWAKETRALRIEVERASSFPAPDQIVIVRVRKTPELFHALVSLRDLARNNNLVDLATIAPADWIFHMSVAYCSSLDSSAWNELSHFVETLTIDPAECVVGEVEIAAFEDGKEYSGAIVKLTSSAAPPSVQCRPTDFEF